jgi:hypothetical protein
MKKIRFSWVLFVFALASVLPGLASADTVQPSEAVHEWAFTQMTQWSPPGHSFYPDARESEEDAKARYRSIVRDAMAVAYDPSEPPLFANRKFVGGKWEVSDDPIGRAKTLAVLLAVADSESGGYRRDVDFNIGKLARGDGGKSWCVMQILLSRPNADGKTDQRIALKGDTYEFVRAKDKGYGGEDLIANRRACFRVALHMARESFRACGHLPVEERLSVYAGGDCTVGRAASRVRVGKAIRWLAAKAPPHVDADLAGAYPADQFASAR